MRVPGQRRIASVVLAVMFAGTIAHNVSAQVTLASTVTAEGTAALPRKGLFGLGKIQVQPETYIALVSQPLTGQAGDVVQLPALPQTGGVNVAWDLKLGQRNVKSGAGTLVSLRDINPGTYRLDVTATDGNTSATGRCLVIVNEAGTVKAGSSTGSSPVSQMQVATDEQTEDPVQQFELISSQHPVLLTRRKDL